MWRCLTRGLSLSLCGEKRVGEKVFPFRKVKGKRKGKRFSEELYTYASRSFEF